MQMRLSNSGAECQGFWPRKGEVTIARFPIESSLKTSWDKAEAFSHGLKLRGKHFAAFPPLVSKYIDSTTNIYWFYEKWIIWIYNYKHCKFEKTLEIFLGRAQFRLTKKEYIYQNTYIFIGSHKWRFFCCEINYFNILMS